ncbi:MAG: aspartate--tRNA ligase [Akkermansiaceae bacterium]|jgi:aspartyl-tRNA synthetase|nr:aspartate--tRNA ligase [Akkermansiaceae bacterium]MDP4645600.1 aspartate--tRNA ligase [Akkermansiaceae bacterium]MDP4719963.1 aspartate--tRNA ligase [Akkermansiaceae bacterium]MDP4779792.1 aspartate--tRNA ligase [Akkermansiaceae bacterium]MDP4846564.1 aspartate--tRNA ligase [Akkermansiaceae bacterium]
MRTHHCNELSESHIDQTVTLIGWVNSARDHGGVIFIDLRDREGLTQCVFRPEENADAATLSHNLREEDVVQVIGKVSKRLEGAENAKMATGAIEIVASDLKIINKADVLPFQLDKELSNEDLRMKYRYLDLRRARMSKNIRQRSKITSAARRYLDDSGFYEIETPILSNPTPEGARDFLVPSRLNPGKFYALPQAPQQYKQLLMVAGVEKYFQIARCFRDEDLRADRQPEFTQIDLEASFVDQEDIIKLVQGLLGAMFKAGLDVDIAKEFPRMTYAEAMDVYGSDKPDTRFDIKITDLADVFAATEFKIFKGVLEGGGVVRAINAKGFATITTGQMNRLNEIAVQAGLPVKNLAFIKLENGEYKSPLWKIFSEEEKAAVTAKMNLEEGDIVFFAAGSRESVSTILGRVRSECAVMQGLNEGSDKFNFLWVVDFPLLAQDEESGEWVAVHHPFTRPHADDLGKLESGDFANVRAQAYDVVLNGYELGGGSIRIHEKDLQAKMFEALGVSPEEQQIKFAHILDAFRFGAPPHGGLALGLDRIAMLVSGEDSIREVIAFPKNNKGADLMAQSPCEIGMKELREVYVQSTYKKKDAPMVGE